MKREMIDDMRYARLDLASTSAASAHNAIRLSDDKYTVYFKRADSPNWQQGSTHVGLEGASYNMQQLTSMREPPMISQITDVMIVKEVVRWERS